MHGGPSPAQLSAIAKQEATAAVSECDNKRLSGELKTHVAVVQCSNPRIIEAFRRIGFPYMDTVTLATAKRLELAERLDKNQITEGQAQLEMAELKTRIATIERERNREARHDAAIREERNTAASLQLLQMGLGMLSGGGAGAGSSGGGRIMCYNNPMASGTMPNPTVCQGF
jgi:hypothetical protein